MNKLLFTLILMLTVYRTKSATVKRVLSSSPSESRRSDNDFRDIKTFIRVTEDPAALYEDEELAENIDNLAPGNFKIVKTEQVILQPINRIVALGYRGRKAVQRIKPLTIYPIAVPLKVSIETAKQINDNPKMMSLKSNTNLNLRKAMDPITKAIEMQKKINSLNIIPSELNLRATQMRSPGNIENNKKAVLHTSYKYVTPVNKIAKYIIPVNKTVKPVQRAKVNTIKPETMKELTERQERLKVLKNWKELAEKDSSESEEIPVLRNGELPDMVMYDIDDENLAFDLEP